jgi:hypothetical protein
MHAEALDFVRRAVAGLNPQRIVEIGSLYTAFGEPVSVNPLRALFPAAHYIGIDVRPGPNVDIVADGATWQPDGWQPDLVLCCEVLEHVPPDQQRAIVENAYAMLADGGTLIITAACEPRKPHTWDGHEHGTEGVDYWNTTPALLPVGSLVETHDRGDLYATLTKPLVVAYA